MLCKCKYTFNPIYFLFLFKFYRSQAAACLLHIYFGPLLLMLLIVSDVSLLLDLLFFLIYYYFLDGTTTHHTKLTLIPAAVSRIDKWSDKIWAHHLAHHFLDPRMAVNIFFWFGLKKHIFGCRQNKHNNNQ